MLDLTVCLSTRGEGFAGVSVEEVSYAVGEVVGFESVKASRMNSAELIFLDDVSKVERLVESGVLLRDTFTPVYELVNPAKNMCLTHYRLLKMTTCVKLCPGTDRWSPRLECSCWSARHLSLNTWCVIGGSFIWTPIVT